MCTKFLNLMAVEILIKPFTSKGTYCTKIIQTQTQTQENSFLDDLETFVKEEKEKNSEIIILIDTNEQWTHKLQIKKKFVRDSNLLDLLKTF